MKKIIMILVIMSVTLLDAANTKKIIGVYCHPVQRPKQAFNDLERPSLAYKRINDKEVYSRKTKNLPGYGIQRMRCYEFLVEETNFDERARKELGYSILSFDNDRGGKEYVLCFDKNRFIGEPHYKDKYEGPDGTICYILQTSEE